LWQYLFPLSGKGWYCVNSFLLTRKLVIVLVFVPVFLGLISLGIRLPVLAGYVKSGPKPRPRALIQNQIKSCKEKIDKACQKLAAASCTCHPCELSYLIAGPPRFIHSPLKNSDQRTAPPRASPAFS
jgi:hypothetical protein